MFKMINNLYTVSGHSAYPMTTVYTVKISEDGQRRAVSKTFDLTQLEYYITVEPPVQSGMSMAHDVVLNVNIGVRKQSNGILERGFYYLKKHTFSIDFETTDLGNIAHVDIENGYDGNPLITYGNNSETHWIKTVLKHYDAGTSNDIINDYVAQFSDVENTHAYLTDITGLTREMFNISDGAFTHSFVLLNGA